MNGAQVTVGDLAGPSRELPQRVHHDFRIGEGGGKGAEDREQHADGERYLEERQETVPAQD